MANILISGGAGFIGSHLCGEFINQKNKVICVDNLSTGSKQNIVNLLDNPDFMFFNLDITQPITPIAERLESIDYILHLASPASPNPLSPRSYINLPIETMLANSFGTYHLLNLAVQKKSKFLLTSTSEIYGDPAVNPQPETYFGYVNPNGIRSVYDEGKRFSEALTFAYLRKYKLDCRVIRIFNTYGPNMQKDDGRVVSNFVNQAIQNQPITIYGDGNQTRSFCFVDDMVKGIIAAIMNQNTKGEIINLGNPDERTVSEIANIIKKLTNSKSEITHELLPTDDPKRRKPDITKAKNILNWEPKITLEEGLRKTIDYFRQI